MSRILADAGRRSIVTLLAALTLAGCVSNVGPRTVTPARYDYNQALATSWNEQMLLNLVRLRYRDTPVFLEVGAVLAQYSVTGSGSATIAITSGDVDDLYGIGGSIEVSESPTITYTPLQGDEFVRQVLAPISPATILLLSQAGWSIERLMLCCVNRLNGLPNAPSAAGPTPDYRPRYEDFHQLARLLRELQVAGHFVFRVDRSGDEEEFVVEIAAPQDPELSRKAAEVARILELDAEQGSYSLVDDALGQPGDLRMSGRALLGVFYYLSQAVSVPAEHLEAGWVTHTVAPDGRDFDWSEVTGRLFNIEYSSERPSNAFTAVRYRGYWFYIDDSDLNSKTTFGLLTLLFSLQASGGQGPSPLLTVGTGN